MAKLYFRYGAMGSSKTANALMVRYNYLERNMGVILLKPRLDQRDGERIIRSRIGLEADCDFVEDFIERMENASPARNELSSVSAVIIDEAQFMTPGQVEFMAFTVVDRYNVPVICYGLRTDFQSRLFPGAARLFELADIIEQIPTVCWCGKKAHFNARMVNGKIVRTGEQVFLGGNESYMALCRRHFSLGQVCDPDQQSES